MVASTLGSHAAGVVLPLLILALTQSPQAVGIASALGIVPYLLLCLPVGVWIDRWDRRWVMMVCDLARAAVAASIPIALWLDVITLAQLYVVAAVQGTLMVFFNIAEVAALPRVVRPSQLHQATAQNHAGYSAAAVIGPAIGTWAYQALGRSLPFVLDALSYVASAWALSRMRSRFEPAAAAGPRDLKAEMMAGLRWLWHERLVRTMAVVTGVSNFVHAALPLLLIVLAQAQGASAAHIGLVFSCGGVGGVVGALAGGWLQRRFSFGQIILSVLVGEALLIPCLWWASSAWALGLVYGAVMFLAPVYNVVQFSYRLGLIPDALQGRVNSAYRLLAHAGQPVGAALCGWLLEHHGTDAALWVFSLAYAALALGTIARSEVRLAPRTPHH